MFLRLAYLCVKVAGVDSEYKINIKISWARLFCVYRLARRFQWTHKLIVYILVENLKNGIYQVRIQGGGGGPDPPTPENSQKI